MRILTTREINKYFAEALLGFFWLLKLLLSDQYHRKFVMLGQW